LKLIHEFKKKVNMAIDIDSKICILGHKGMVGSAVFRYLTDQGFTNLITATSEELDLRNQSKTDRFMAREKPDIVILAAAKVGGIRANIKNPAGFLGDNLLIQGNVISASVYNKVKQFVFLGSSCIYPRECLQPMREEYLLTGPLEPTNEGYAIAKIAGLKLLNFLKIQGKLDSISLMPCNLYGPNDSFDLENSHVLSALVKRFVDAKMANSPEILLWGTGVARREFMHVDDLVRAIIFLLENVDHCDYINVGTGFDISIRELASRISNIIDYEGRVIWDATKPDGMMRKCMDVSKIQHMGFEAKITLNDGLVEMIETYKRTLEF
jgi:GDP-L-fucose synthase